MKNYKKIFIFLISIVSVLSIKAIGAEIIGEVVSSDIAMFIDRKPIKSYNVNGSTYILASDLRGYGFFVVWNESERTVNITRGSEKDYFLMSQDEINILKSEIITGQKLYDLYSTDIKVYINGNLIEAAALSGATLVKFRDLEVFGPDIIFLEEMRQANLDMIEFELYTAFESAEKQELVIDEKTTYIGEVLNGLPNGIGKMYTNDEKYLSVFKGTTSDSLQVDSVSDEKVKFTITDFGYFKDGKKDGIVMTGGEYVAEILISSAPMVVLERLMEIEIIGSYSNGIENGLIIEMSANHHGEFIRRDYFSENGYKGLEYYSIYDSDYLYRYQVLSVRKPQNEIY